MIPNSLVALLDDWVRDAVARHGDDWPAIMAAVEQNLRELGLERRAALSDQIARAFASTPGASDSNLN